MANTSFPKRDGFGGRKTAYFDTMTFRHIPEGGARSAALETGEVHAVDMLPPSAADRLKGNPNVKIYAAMPWAFQTIIINASWGATANVKVRQAIQATLDCEEIMAIAGEGLYRLTHGWQHPGTTYFAGDVGKEHYNQKNSGQGQAAPAGGRLQGRGDRLPDRRDYKNHQDTAVVAASR